MDDTFEFVVNFFLFDVLTLDGVAWVTHFVGDSCVNEGL